MNKSGRDVESVFDGLAILLQTGDFSDLTLVCEGKEFHVHKAIICPRSPVFAAAVKGTFKEATDSKIAVEVTDSVTLQHALTYLYTGTYDEDDDYYGSEDSTSRHESCVNHIRLPSTSEISPPSQDPDTQNDVSPQQSEDQLPAENPQTLPLLTDQASEITNDSKHSSDSECEYCIVEKERVDCINASLRTNTLVYILGDYYQIPQLSKMAQRKFFAALDLDHFCAKDFGRVCRLVYECLPEEAAKWKTRLCDVICRNSELLVKDAAFMATALSIPELLRDTFVQMVDQRIDAIVERDTALESQIISEADRSCWRNAYTQAHEDFAAERNSILVKVNDADHCRHCGLDNNVSLEHSPGNTYILRCKCRTKY